MIIIGEKINGAIPSVAQAIQERDSQKIRELARLQEENGADYLDVCAGTAVEREEETLLWLMEVIQEQTDLPLCLDSPSPEILTRVMPYAKRPGILNSVSGEGEKCDILYPHLQGNDWQVIALTCDRGGIPADAGTKTRIALELIEKADAYRIAPARIHIDPLVLSLSAMNRAMVEFNQAIVQIKAVCPQVKIAAALSNISYGLPCRRLVNQYFLAFAIGAGLDTVIADPASRDIHNTIYTAEALLGKDRLCRHYIKAFRSGRIGVKK